MMALIKLHLYGFQSREPMTIAADKIIVTKHEDGYAITQFVDNREVAFLERIKEIRFI